MTGPVKLLSFFRKVFCLVRKKGYGGDKNAKHERLIDYDNKSCADFEKLFTVAHGRNLLCFHQCRILEV